MHYAKYISNCFFMLGSIKAVDPMEYCNMNTGINSPFSNSYVQQ